MWERTSIVFHNVLHKPLQLHIGRPQKGRLFAAILSVIFRNGLTLF